MRATPQPDFLRPVRGPHPLSKVACGVAMLAAMLAGLDALDAWSERSEALARRAAPPASAPLLLPPVDNEARRAMKQAVSSLNRPWPLAFGAVENSSVPSVAWLSLDIGEGGSLRLEGLAPDAQRVLAAAEALRRQRGWREVLVARMDKSTDGQHRFSLVAVPSEGAW